jgi:hypothetical protein
VAFIKLSNINFEYDPTMHVFVLTFDLVPPGATKSSRYVARFQPTDDPTILPAQSTSEDTLNNKYKRSSDYEGLDWKP